MKVAGHAAERVARKRPPVDLKWQPHAQHVGDRRQDVHRLGHAIHDAPAFCPGRLMNSGTRTISARLRSLALRRGMPSR